MLALLLAAWAVGAIGGGGLFAGGDEAGARPNGLPPGWASLEPLLPLAPGLTEMSAFKRSAAGGASRVLGARTDGEGALRLRALPTSAGTPSRPAVRRIGAPRARRLAPTRLITTVGAPVDRIVDVRRLLRRPILGDLNQIFERDLRGLPGSPGAGDGVSIPRIDIPRVEIPPIGPFPGTGPIPGGSPLPGGNPTPGGNPIPGWLSDARRHSDSQRGRSAVRCWPVDGDSLTFAAINVTVGDLSSDSRSDVLLVSSGRRVVERYVFRDRDIAGLTAQVDLRSRLLAADVLRNGEPLAYVAAAPVTAGGAKAAGARSGDSGSGKERAGRAGTNRRSGRGGDSPSSPPPRAIAGARGADRSTPAPLTAPADANAHAVGPVATRRARPAVGSTAPDRVAGDPPAARALAPQSRRARRRPQGREPAVAGQQGAPQVAPSPVLGEAGVAAGTTMTTTARATPERLPPARPRWAPEAGGRAHAPDRTSPPRVRVSYAAFREP